jgi:hypothetical protein
MLGLPKADWGMADTTTVKVQTSIGDLLLRLGASRRPSTDGSFSTNHIT